MKDRCLGQGITPCQQQSNAEMRAGKTTPCQVVFRQTLRYEQDEAPPCQQQSNAEIRAGKTTPCQVVFRQTLRCEQDKAKRGSVQRRT